VDVYAPGCAIRPEAIIDAVVQGLGVLEEKRVLLAAGKLEPAEMPALPSAANKTLHGRSVALSWKDAIAQAQESSKEEPSEKEAPAQEEE